MKDITRYRIMRKFRSKHKIVKDIIKSCPDPEAEAEIFGFNYTIIKCDRCEDLCYRVFGITSCPCTEFGCSTALRKLDAWLRKEKKRLGVTE